VAITQYILGIRPTLDGLAIRPVIPTDWKGFKAVRVYRGVRYEIDVTRKGKGNNVHLVVDGKSVAGDRVPLPDSGMQRVSVQVTLD
jgi:cellobiose phosphorylase